MPSIETLQDLMTKKISTTPAKEELGFKPKKVKGGKDKTRPELKWQKQLMKQREIKRKWIKKKLICQQNSEILKVLNLKLF